MRSSGTRWASYAGCAAFLAAALLLVTPPVHATAEATVTVYEDAGVARTEVVSVGVPFAAADGVTRADVLRVRGEDGADVPSQSRVLARWDASPDSPDAPVRIALVRFLARVPAHGEARYVIAPGAVTEPGVAIAQQGAAGILVDTGAFRARFGAGEAGPLAPWAAAPGEPLAPLPRAGAVVLEDNGPLYASIEVRGESARGYREDGGTHPLRWVARWELARGEPGARVTFTVENPDRMFEHPYNKKGAPRGKEIGELSLVWDDATASGATLRAGGVRNAAARLRVVQISNALLVDGSPMRNARLEGWIAAAAARESSLIAIAKAWQNAPVALSGGDGRLSVSLFPREEPQFLQGSRAKTWELTLRRGRFDVATTARAALAPLRVAVDPRRMRETEALGPISISDAKRWPAFEKTVAGLTDPRTGLDAEREHEGDFGWLDYGDTMRSGSRAKRLFGNNEFDFGGVLLRLYLRDPKHPRARLDAAHDALRHLADVDILHTDDDADWVNHGVHKHDEDDDREHVHNPDFSHFWVRGLLQYWLATGDERSHDAAMEIARWIEAREDAKRPGTYAWADELRDVGWLLVAIDDYAEATGDAAWLSRARRLVHATVLPNVDAEGTMRDASFLESDRGWFAPWQEAYVADGLGRYCLLARRRGAPDGDAEATLLRMLGYLAGDGPWIRGPVTLYGRTYRESIAFEMTRGGKDAHEASMTQALVDPFVWGFLLTRDERWRRQAARANAEVFPAGPEIYFDPSIGTPAKNAAMRLYFGEAERWLEQISPR